MDSPNLNEFVVKINTDHCGRCSICSSVCPFEALPLDPETKEVKLDIEKCQVCGICYSACPASAIESVYYDLDALFQYLVSQMQIYKSRVLVLTCRGSVPDSKDIQDIAKVAHFIPLCLPCVGRVSVEFFLKALSLGIKKVIVIPCQQDFCCFKDGSIITARRLSLLRLLLHQFGYAPETLTLVTGKTAVHIDDTKCVACLTCIRVCDKYEAPFINQAGVAEIDVAKCSGCGVCVGECPAQAIQYLISPGLPAPERK